VRETHVNDVQTESIFAWDSPDALPTRGTRDGLGVPIDAEVADIETLISFGLPTRVVRGRCSALT